jgi:cholesterol oxidase
VQAMGHCVGGLSLFMAIGGGLEGVRAATFSSLAGHPIATPGNRLRAGVHLATAFKKLGIKGLNTDYDPGYLPDRAVELVMRALPYRNVYDSPVGRRIYFIYGDVFDFSNINETTMESAVPSIFGISNITFFEHISRMIRKNRAVDRNGKDAYLSNVDRYRMPITFLTGEHNRMFVPQGLQRSYELVRQANDPGLYSHHVFTNYAHLDMWLGDNAADDIFPTALDELERQDS